MPRVEKLKEVCPGGVVGVGHQEDVLGLVRERGAREGKSVEGGGKGVCACGKGCDEGLPGWDEEGLEGVELRSEEGSEGREVLFRD